MYSVARDADGLFYIRHPKHPGLAWSHVAGGWVPHTDGQGSGNYTVLRFETSDDADDYATDEYLYPRRD